MTPPPRATHRADKIRRQAPCIHLVTRVHKRKKQDGNGSRHLHPYRPEVRQAIPRHDRHRRPVEDLRDGFDQQVIALRGISLKIKVQRIRRHHGTLRLRQVHPDESHRLPGLPQQGNYWLNNQLSRLNDDQLARIRNKEIGFVFQTFNLLPRATSLQNVELPLIYNGTPPPNASTAQKQSSNRESRRRMLHKPNELSGGQRQRVAIARALVNNPSIILADEPTGNLDSKTGEEIMALFDELHAQGNTIILVTHEPDIAEYAHRIVTIRDGVIANDHVSPRFLVEN